MEIMLLCENNTGQAAFPAEIIEGIPVPERHYGIIDGMLTLSGFSDVILHHDAEELLKQSLFRLPTPAEQEKLAKAAREASQIQEGAEQGETSAPPALDNQEADAPTQSKKKASGG